MGKIKGESNKIWADLMSETIRYVDDKELVEGEEKGDTEEQGDKNS